MRVVIDTKIFVSSFFGGNPRKIIDLWKNEKITLCLSNAILDEYVDVLSRIGLKEENELEELLSLFSVESPQLFLFQMLSRSIPERSYPDASLIFSARPMTSLRESLRIVQAPAFPETLHTG
jgi:predicted nucleic acid-binding protein